MHMNFSFLFVENNVIGSLYFEYLMALDNHSTYTNFVEVFSPALFISGDKYKTILSTPYSPVDINTTTSILKQ